MTKFSKFLIKTVLFLVIFIAATKLMKVAIPIAILICIITAIGLIIIFITKLRKLSMRSIGFELVIIVGVLLMLFLLIKTQFLKLAFGAKVMLAVGAIYFSHFIILKKFPYVETLLHGKSDVRLRYRIVVTCTYAFLLVLLVCGIMAALKYLFVFAFSSMFEQNANY